MTLMLQQVEGKRSSVRHRAVRNLTEVRGSNHRDVMRSYQEMKGGRAAWYFWREPFAANDRRAFARSVCGQTSRTRERTTYVGDGVGISGTVISGLGWFRDRMSP